MTGLQTLKVTVGRYLVTANKLKEAVIIAAEENKVRHENISAAWDICQDAEVYCDYIYYIAERILSKGKLRNDEDTIKLLTSLRRALSHVRKETATLQMTLKSLENL